MTDIAALGLKVDFKEVRDALGVLDDFTDAAERATRETDEFGDESERAARQTNKLGREARTADGSFNKLSSGIGRTVGGLLALAGVTAGGVGLVRMSDEYTSMTNVLRLFAEDQESVNGLLSELDGIASRTRAPLSAMTQLYQRVSLSARDLGASQETALRFTENVGLALAQQGGSAEQARGALLQLSQAMGAQVVRAEEFNSILEGAYPIALAAAKGIDAAGGSVAKLRMLVIEGKISSQQFFDAILSQTDELEAAFGKTVPTIGQGFARLGDSLTLFVGRFNEMTGLSGAVASGILSVADNVEMLAGYLVAAGTAAAVSYVPNIIRAARSTTILGSSLLSLRGALIATGIGAVVVAAGFLIGKFLELTEAAGGFGAAWGLVWDVVLEVTNRILLAGDTIVSGYRAYTASFVLLWREALAGITQFFATFIDGIIDQTRQALIGTGQFAAAAALEVSRGSIRNAAASAAESARESADAQRELVKQNVATTRELALRVLAPLESWEALVGVIRTAREEQELASRGVVTPPTRAPGATQDQIDAAREYVKALAEEREAIGLTGFALKQLEIDRAAAAAEGTGLAVKILQEGEQLKDAIMADAERNRQLRFDREVMQLARQADAWLLYGEQRSVALSLNAIEEQRRQDLINMGLGLTEQEIDAQAKLTEKERNMLSAILLNNMALEQRSNILSALQSPIDQYLRASQAVTELYERDAISTDAGSLALRETDLMRGVRDIEFNVPGRDRSSDWFEPLGGGAASELEELDALYKERSVIIDQAEQAGYYLEEEAAQRRLDLWRHTEAEITRIRKGALADLFTSMADGVGALTSAIGEAMGEQSGIYKTMLGVQKAFVLAASILNIQKAMSEALALPFPANLAQYAIVAAEGANIISTITSLSSGFKMGGYTGAGGADDVAGVVHRGEVVWSQSDVARYGGWQNVDAMRRGSYAPANDNYYQSAATGGGSAMQVDVRVSVDDDGKLQAYVAGAQREAVTAAVTISDGRTKARIDAQQTQSVRPQISAGRSAA